MIVTFVKCEQCENKYPIAHNQKWDMPSGWMSLAQKPYHNQWESLHFCSCACLAQWTGVVSSPQTTKIRRFLLVDGETADEFEGVLYSSGRVSVDVNGGVDFRDWEHLKRMNPGSGITWIDSEISNALD